ncbi:hypothetical protein F5051DRAFT_136174 [Lentinula edodes]|nr:hypothetical protein F5051DRAFT_136174 [Lentinula edodes]
MSYNPVEELVCPSLYFLASPRTRIPHMYSMEYTEVVSVVSAVRRPGTPDSDCLQRDGTYYLPCKIFLVDNRLFQIPFAYLSNESEIFRGMMDVPLPSDGTAEGMSDDHPIRLEGVSKEDFRQLLRVLCPPKAFGREEVLSFKQWISVLKLADLWCMDAVRAHAIKKMSDMDADPVEKVVVARQYKVHDWLVPAFNAIISRSQTLSEVDVERLGVSTILRLVAIRDRLQRDYRNYVTLSATRQPVAFDFTNAILAEIPECRRGFDVLSI